MTTVVSIIISDLVPLRARGTWQGVLNIIFSVGSATGAPLGGIFSDTIGWRWAFYFQVPLAFIAFLSVSLALENSVSVTEESFKAKLKRVDFLGSAILVIAVFCLLLGLERGGNTTYESVSVISLLVGAILLFAIFVLVEAKVAIEPLAPIRIMSNTSLLVSYLCNFFAFAGAMAVVFNLSLYYQAVEKLTAKQAGLGLIPGVAAAVSGSVISGLIMQKTGKFYALTVSSYSLMLAGNVVVIATTGLMTHTLVGNYIGLGLGSFGNGVGVTTTLVALIATASVADQAVVIAVSYLFRSLGVVVGISVSTALVQGNLKRSLEEKLKGENVAELIRRIRESLDYVDQLDPETQAHVRTSYEGALFVAFCFALALSFLTVICSIFIKEKPLVRK